MSYYLPETDFLISNSDIYGIFFKNLKKDVIKGKSNYSDLDGLAILGILPVQKDEIINSSFALKKLTENRPEVIKKIKKILMNGEIPTFEKGRLIFDILKEHKISFKAKNLKYVNQLLKNDIRLNGIISRKKFLDKYNNADEVIKEKNVLIRNFFEELEKQGIDLTLDNSDDPERYEKIKKLRKRLIGLLTRYNAFELKKPLKYHLNLEIYPLLKELTGKDKPALTKMIKNIKQTFEDFSSKHNEDILFLFKGFSSLKEYDKENYFFMQHKKKFEFKKLNNLMFKNIKKIYKNITVNAPAALETDWNFRNNLLNVFFEDMSEYDKQFLFFSSQKIDLNKLPGFIDKKSKLPLIALYQFVKNINKEINNKNFKYYVLLWKFPKITDIKSLIEKKVPNINSISLSDDEKKEINNIIERSKKEILKINWDYFENKIFLNLRNIPIHLNDNTDYKFRHILFYSNIINNVSTLKMNKAVFNNLIEKILKEELNIDKSLNLWNKKTLLSSLNEKFGTNFKNPYNALIKALDTIALKTHNAEYFFTVTRLSTILKKIKMPLIEKFVAENPNDVLKLFKMIKRPDCIFPSVDFLSVSFKELSGNNMSFVNFSELAVFLKSVNNRKMEIIKNKITEIANNEKYINKIIPLYFKYDKEKLDLAREQRLTDPGKTKNAIDNFINYAENKAVWGKKSFNETIKNNLLYTNLYKEKYKIYLENNTNILFLNRIYDRLYDKFLYKSFVENKDKYDVWENYLISTYNRMAEIYDTDLFLKKFGVKNFKEHENIEIREIADYTLFHTVKKRLEHDNIVNFEVLKFLLGNQEAHEKTKKIIETMLIQIHPDSKIKECHVFVRHLKSLKSFNTPKLSIAVSEGYNWEIPEKTLNGNLTHRGYQKNEGVLIITDEFYQKNPDKAEKLIKEFNSDFEKKLKNAVSYSKKTVEKNKKEIKELYPTPGQQQIFKNMLVNFPKKLKTIEKKSRLTFADGVTKMDSYLLDKELRELTKKEYTAVANTIYISDFNKMVPEYEKILEYVKDFGQKDIDTLMEEKEAKEKSLKGIKHPTL